MRFYFVVLCSNNNLNMKFYENISRWLLFQYLNQVPLKHTFLAQIKQRLVSLHTFCLVAWKRPAFAHAGKINAIFSNSFSQSRTPVSSKGKVQD